MRIPVCVCVCVLGVIILEYDVSETSLRHVSGYMGLDLKIQL